MWELYSERAFRVQELRHTFGMEMGSVKLDRGNVPALQTPVAYCLGIVTVEISSSKSDWRTLLFKSICLLI